MKYVSSVKMIPSFIMLNRETQFAGTYVEVLPLDAEYRDLTWSSSDPSIAEVDENGIITAKKSFGSVTITAMNMFSGNSAQIEVFVPLTAYSNLVSTIYFKNTAISMQVGGKTSMQMVIGPEAAFDKSLDWYSSNTEVVTVGKDGVFTAQGQGTARVIACARDGSGKYAYCDVTVSGFTPVSSIVLRESEKRMLVGESCYLSATVSPSNATDRSVTWKSSDPTVATVNSESGLVMAHKAGTATISAEACDGSGVVGTCALTVIDPIYINNIILSKKELTLYNGNSYTLTANIYPADATTQTIKWSSSNTNVVRVNATTGFITAKGTGTAWIYADAQDGSGVRDCCKVTVQQTILCPVEETPINKVHESTFADPVEVYTGAHLLQNTLMSLFGGQGLNLVAHYDSTQLACGTLGTGWYHNYEKHIEVEGCEAYVYNNPSVFSRYTAVSDCCTTFTCWSANKNGYVLTVDSSRQYPYIIDCNSAHTEYYNANGDLAKIVDHQGFETLITYSGTLITVTDGVSGKKMYLEKDSTCKIVRVYDDAGREAILTYCGNFLVNICDVNQNTLSYTYDTIGRVISGTDSKGLCYFTNTYDSLGRVTSQKDAIAGSAESKFEYQDCKRITTNRNGQKSIREYDCNGLLISYTDENGNTKTYEYDERYNVINESDAKCNSIYKCYNKFNKPTEITDRNGNKTYITYDSAGNVVKIQYPAVDGVVPEETFAYNSRNQMTQHTDLRGTVIVYTYDTNGMPATKKVGDKNAVKYTYEKGLLKSQTDALGNTTCFVHNAIGQIISRTNADNKVTQFVYDKSGNLLKTVDADGKMIVNTYDGNYQKTSVTDANGNTTEYSYNGNMKNDVVTLPDGHTVRYEFDWEDRPTQIIDQANKVTSVEYDPAGRVIKKTFPDGAILQYTYDTVGNVVKETNPKGATVTKTYDKAGNVLTVTDNAGNTTSYEYNAMSKVTKVTNAAGGSTEFEYSKAGDLLSETDALGNKKTYTYDAYGNRLTATDAKNNVTTYTYDANNNLLTVKDALGRITTYTYNCLNRCVSVKDAMEHTIQYGYDVLGRRTTVTDAKGNVFTTTYDGNGNVIKTTDAKGNTVSETAYNCLNLPFSVTDAMGKTTVYTYNALGKVESITDALGHRSEYTYNSRGQNTKVVDAADKASTAAYDLLGNVTELAGPLGGKTTYTYDSMGRLTSESTVSGGTKSYTYNELNVRKQLTNARGQVRQLSYDANGRVTGYTSPEGTVRYTYDANGNVLTVVDSKGTIARTYDKLNRVVSYTDTYGKTIGYEYDVVGNLSKLTYPDNTAVTYEYDANHNLIKVTDWANRVTAYTYDENNRVVGVTKPDGSVTTTVYDNKQRVTSTVEKTASGAVITGFEYTYDDLSRIVEEKHLDKNTKFCYTYDTLNRVTKRIVKNLSNVVLSEETFTYDAAGNVTDAPDSCFAYDTNNRLVVFNGNSVSYDMDGNMLSNGSLSCTYDSANRLVSASGHTYTYNAEDVRIRNLCAEEDTTYTYNTNAKLSMLLMKTTNGVVTKYVYGRGLIGEEVSGAFKTYHFDFRGSTIAITDASGNITDTFAYDTYGKLLSRTGTNSVIFGYNGRDGVVTDKNGLIYMRARYYSPEMKRFINADILAGEILSAVTLNRYAYADSNPVSKTDPFGLKSDFEKWYTKKKREFYQKVVGFVLDKVETAFEVRNAVAREIVDTVEDKAQEFVEWGSQKVEEATEQIEEVVTEVVDRGTEIIGRGVERAKTTIERGKEMVDAARTRIIDSRKRTFDSIIGFGQQLGEWVSNTFGAGVVQSENYDAISLENFFFGYETGLSKTSVICGDISTPVSVYAKNSSKWWRIWEYKIGFQFNIGDGGFYLESNPLEHAMGFSDGNQTLELMYGVNKIGYTRSFEVDFSNRTSGGLYHHRYVRSLPTAVAAVATVTACYFLPALVGFFSNSQSVGVAT